MKKLLGFIMLCATLLMSVNSDKVYAQNTYTVNRIYGDTRFETSIKASTYFSDSKIKNIILANGEDFADALTGSILVNKINAPILLVSKSPENNSLLKDYIENHLLYGGTVYILGGESSISENLVNDLNISKHYTIKRLSGIDRFNTNSAIVNSVSIKKGTPVLLVNGFNFADAISASSVAAVNGYPILLGNQTFLDPSIKENLKNIEPSKVYLIWGKNSLSDALMDAVLDTNKNLTTGDIIRIAGTDRYETSINTCKYFNLNSDTALLTNGENFADSLSAISLAADLKAPILLTNGTDISKQQLYLENTNYRSLICIGGKDSISEKVEKDLSVRKSKDSIVTFADKNLESVIRQTINKPTGELFNSDVEKIIKLNADAKNIKNIGGIDQLTNLKELSLYNNQISDISPIKDLTGLLKLNLGVNEITAIDDMKNLTSLSKLCLGSNKISKIDALKNLTNLEEFICDYNEITDIHLLNTFTKLKILNLTKNQISDISPLKELIHLNSLYLGCNQISDITPLKNLVDLTELYLPYNQIDDITALSKMSSLEILYLSDNKITNILPLKNLSKLKQLILTVNNISDSDKKDLKEALPDSGIIY